MGGGKLFGIEIFLPVSRIAFAVRGVIASDDSGRLGGLVGCGLGLSPVQS